MYSCAMAGPHDSQLEFDVEWLREQRSRLGWSTTTAAKRAREKAREFGDAIKLSQQLVSKFENGHLKSVPRWLGYMQLAMADEINEKGLPEGRLWKLKLPKDLQTYFAEIFFTRNSAELADAEDLDDLSDEDLADIELMHRLSPQNREAVRDLMRALLNPGTAPTREPQDRTPPGAGGSSTLHSPPRKYAGGRR